MDNHLHLVLRNRPDIVASWADEEVARRWWFVCPLRKNDDGTIPDPLHAELRLLMQDVAEYRRRLSDISWLMRLLCQPIGRRANQEDGVDGRFFAHRFDCKRLESIADVLACSLYVDLNAVQAGLADTPEDSAFTSAFDRIRAHWHTVQVELADGTSSPNEDDWLAPVFLDERAAAYTGTESVAACNPVRSARISNKGFLPLRLDQYLSLLDAMGRIVRPDKAGSIPQHLPPILERISRQASIGTKWFTAVFEFFSRDLQQRPLQVNSPAVVINSG